MIRVARAPSIKRQRTVGRQITAARQACASRDQPSGCDSSEIGQSRTCRDRSGAALRNRNRKRHSRRLSVDDIRAIAVHDVLIALRDLNARRLERRLHIQTESASCAVADPVLLDRVRDNDVPRTRQQASESIGDPIQINPSQRVITGA